MTPDRLKETGRIPGETFARDNWASNTAWLDQWWQKSECHRSQAPFTYNFYVAVQEYVQQRKVEARALSLTNLTVSPTSQPHLVRCPQDLSCQCRSRC